MKEFTIHSSGPTSRDIVIVDSDGNKVEDVIAADIKLEGGEHNKATFEILLKAVNVKVELDMTWLICPFCKGFELHDCDDSSSTLGGT